MAAQMQLPMLSAAPDPRRTDLFVVWESGGKDSAAQLIEAYRWAEMHGVTDRMVVAHNDLGDMEWPGTLDLARRHAEHFGLPFHVVRRSDGVELLDDVARRGKFPDAKRRWCTSDHKRGPGRRLITALVGELGLSRQAKVVQMYGLRAAESKGRAEKCPLVVNADASSGVREVIDWLPIQDWSDQQVWPAIHSERLPYHWAYARGMSRLSCSFCVLSARDDLITAARLRPRLLARYIGVETATGSSFQVTTRQKNKVKTFVPKPIADFAQYANFDQPPCEHCSAGLDEGVSPVGTHEVPDLVARAMFRRTGLVCDGRRMRDARTGRPASRREQFDELAEAIHRASFVRQHGRPAALAA